MSAKLSRRAVLGSLGAACAGALLVPDLSSVFGLGNKHVPAGVAAIARQVPVLGTRVTLVVRHPDQRLAQYAIRQAVRASGAGSLADIAAVVLETDGSLSVISADRLGDGSALGGLSV